MSEHTHNPDLVETAEAAGAHTVTEHGSGAVLLPVDDWARDSAVWQRVSTKYAWADFVMNLLLALAVTAVLAVIVWAGGNDVPVITYVIMAAISVVLVVSALFAFRRVRAIGYCLRDDDLLFRRGILFERIIAVPYGRLQLVDVTRGPLLRSLGLATLKFVTASAATGVQLPGLTLAEAETLRDRLVVLAETRRSGL